MLPEVISAYAWKGTVAADESDRRSVQQFFRERGDIRECDHVVRITISEQASSRGRPWVRVVVTDRTEYTEVAAQLLQPRSAKFIDIEIELTLEEFFRLFKRFNMVIDVPGLNLDGGEYEFTTIS